MKKAILSGYILDIQNVFFFSITLQSEELGLKTYNIQILHETYWARDEQI